MPVSGDPGTCVIKHSRVATMCLSPTWGDNRAGGLPHIILLNPALALPSPLQPFGISLSRFVRIPSSNFESPSWRLVLTREQLRTSHSVVL